MESFRREFDTLPADTREVVLTYRPPEEVEPVVLSYSRDLPACMQPAPDPGVDGEPSSRKRWNPLDPPERPKKKWGVRLYVGISLLVIVVCLGVGLWYVGEYGWTLPGVRQLPSDNHPGAGQQNPDEGYYYYWDEEPVDESKIHIPSYPTGGETRLELAASEELPVLSIQEVYDKVTPSVVAVLAGQEFQSTVSVGTGVIFSEDGYILTNCHVIAGCSICKVWVTNEYGVDSRYEAKLVGCDPDVDLAVLKIEAAEPLPAAEFGVSDDLAMGDKVYAIGNPLGVKLRNTLTDGIISAVNRDVDVDGVEMTLLQTTAALNSGNSGGPLINEYGQVIGINTIKMMSSYETIEGLGFAIPTSFAKRWVNELIEFGELQPLPVLGVSVNKVPVTLPDGQTGMRLESITPGLSSDRAGLHDGDYLVEFDEQPVSSYQQILNIRRELRVGDEVPVLVWRDGEYIEKTLIMMAE